MLNNYFSRLVLGGILLSVVGSLTAQTFEDPDGEAVAEPEVVEEAVLDESQLENLPDVSESGQESGYESFIPSEDISEDFSVPFPVDI